MLRIWTRPTVTVTVLKWDSVVFNSVVLTKNADGMTNGIVQWVCTIYSALSVQYSRFSLSRNRRDPQKHFEISVLRHIRFVVLRKTNLTNQMLQWLCNLTPLIRNIYWKYCGIGEKLLPSSNFSSFPHYFVTWFEVSVLKQGPDCLFEISGYSR